MTLYKLAYKKTYNYLINGVSSLQLTKNKSVLNSNDFDKLDLNFDKFKFKLKLINSGIMFQNIDLNKKVKTKRKQKGFPVNGQRTRSNSRTALYLKNKYKHF